MPVLGKIGLVNRGTYSASAQYTALDFVLYNGSSYVALKSVKGVTPTNDGTNWQTLAEGTAAAMYLENSLTYTTAGQRALDAAQGPVIQELIDAKADTTSVPPKNHASTATTYGQGNASNYGHVKTTDTYSTKQASAAAADGIVPSQNALYNAYANRAPISHASTGTTYGQGNASNFGHVKLSDTYATKQSSAAAANGVAASQNALYNAYNSVHALTNGSATCNSKFQVYHTSPKRTTFDVDKINGVVHISVVLEPIQNISFDNVTSSTDIFTLPSGFRPKRTVYAICHASGMNVWMLTISPNGNAVLGRHGTDEITNLDSGSWLPMSISFVAA